ncbi:MAG: aminotransferase class V-fold PLP-dependent enzyme, partial [Chitinophagaceae bacterium]
GTISAEKIISAIKKNTILVSVIFVSNEIGSVLPVREIGLAIRYQISDIRYHIDAVQAAQFYNLNVEKLGCDLLTLSAHKIYGPKGIGALYVKKGSKLKNLLYGGSQEYGLRPGTQSTSGIIGFAKAVELLGSLEERQVAAEKIKKLRDKLLEFVQTLPNVEINGPTGESRVANNISFIVFGADQDALMTVLDLAGIAASTGSACTSGSVEPSHVIQSLRKIAKQKAATIRLSLGRKTTVSEINATIRILKRIV